MWCEAYIIFSSGQIGAFQKAMWPSCFVKYIDCESEMVQHVGGYIQICGIIAGMLIFGSLMDYIGRRWGGRSAVLIMLTGAIMLVFTPFANTPHGYYAYFMTAQTWFGFGVGAEYPFASASASERSATTEELRYRRGETVVLVFSNQGLGNLCNGCVILIAMTIYGETGASLSSTGSARVLFIMYGVVCVVLVLATLFRTLVMEESELFSEEESIEEGVEVGNVGLRKQLVSLYYYGPRQFVASAAWVANDFAFYGNKLQQSKFINLLYPGAVYYKQMQWTVLNSFIALTGYYTAAALVDKPWYGRVWMQNIGFIAMFVFFIIIYGQWANMGGACSGCNPEGAKAFQALYYLSSYFNQFGPNATTWLVAGEIFPTNIRAGYHGFAAAMGKVGAIIASLWISYIPADKQDQVFLISSMFALLGWLVTAIWLPDTTGLELEEYDRLQRHALEGSFKNYHGEAVNPKHLSIWEYRFLKWGDAYDPDQDQRDFINEMKAIAAKNDKAGKSCRTQIARLLDNRGIGHLAHEVHGKENQV